jgi:hypothetical protein
MTMHVHHVLDVIGNIGRSVFPQPPNRYRAVAKLNDFGRFPGARNSMHILVSADASDSDRHTNLSPAFSLFLAK